MFKLPETDKDLLQGVCELHIHAAPDISERPFSEVDLAQQARDAGYRAILFKSHHAISAGRSDIVGKVVPGIHVFGGVVLNLPVGGINPFAVEAAIGLGAKEVWMPTLHAANHIKVVGMAGYPKHSIVEAARKPRLNTQGIRIIDSSGELIPQVQEVLGLVADADIMLGTCHLSLEEELALVAAGRRTSLKKMMPMERLWPVNEFWNYHSAGERFQTMDRYNEAMEKTYGKPVGLEDYIRKSQAMAYDGERAMFEAYARNKYTSTGVVQWMINNAWPSMIWHLYDYFLRPGGGYFGTKKACEPLHVQYSYDDRSVVLINSTYRETKKLKAK
jgi:hypothetical protein